jgi:uncharacterized protein
MTEALAFGLHLRVPGWCENFTLKINGKAVDAQIDAGGYVALTREWRSGDWVEYTMEMPVRLTWANPAVRQLEGRAAIERGPLVFCLEGVDHNGIVLDRIAIDGQRFAQECSAVFRPDLLGGTIVIHGKGTLIEEDGWGNALYRSEPPRTTQVELTAIPYCLWDNRAPGEMRVWLRAA